VVGTINPGAVLRRGQRIAYRELGSDHGSVLLHLDTGAYHGVDRIGALVWEMLDDSPSFAELVPRLRERFDEVPESFEREIADFLSSLRERGLIEVVDPIGG
jgi:hypothetical protein